MKTIGHGIVINASPSSVWRVLMDWPRFGAWNPFLTDVEGEPRLGSRLSVRIAPPEGRPMRFRPKLTALEPSRDFNGSGGPASQGCSTEATPSA